MNNDHDLRERFAHQRHSDHEHAPAWNPDLIRAAPKQPSWHPPLWLPITAAACMMISLVWIRSQPTQPTDLASALPEFFSPQGDPLFASLIASPALPSDSLLPVHLTIQLP